MMTGGRRPEPAGPLLMGEHGRERWFDEDATAIETMTLTQFYEAMAIVYEDWYEFVDWIERRQEQ